MRTAARQRILKSNVFSLLFFYELPTLRVELNSKK